MVNGKQKPKVELIPDKWVYLQLLQDKPATGVGDYGTWYLYSVKLYSDQLKLWEERSFFPSPKLQALIESIGIKAKEQFAVMEKATINPKSKKPFTYFDVEYKKERYSTRTESEDTSPEPLLKEQEKFYDIPDMTLPTIQSPPLDEPCETNPTFGDTAIEVWETVLAWVTPKSIEDMTPDQYISTRLKIVEICSAMVNTITIQNGGKR